jgi:uridine phosphorylase
MGGTAKRMQRFANYMKDTLDFDIPTGLDLKDLSKLADRFSMYKLGPILFANHGMGCPSLSILLNEIMKLLFYAGCHDVTFFRIGTCGGIGFYFIFIQAFTNRNLSLNNFLFLIKKESSLGRLCSQRKRLTAF